MTPFSRLAVRLALPALLFAASAAEAEDKQPANPTAAKTARIDRNGVLILVRGTLSALDQANKTGNYTVLRDLAAPGFAAANDPAQLAEIFAKLRKDKTDLSGVLALEPQLSQPPDLDAAGNMRLAGFFPSAPLQLNFQMLFAAVNGQWRLFGLATDLAPSGPVAPTPEPPPPTPQGKPPATKPEPKKP